MKSKPKGIYISISQYCEINIKDFERSGAFDAFLDIDSQLFIDPHLLASTDVIEFKDAYLEISKRFENVLLLISQSSQIDDIFWHEAEKLMTFSEVKGLCMGYSNTGTSGSGIGKKLRRQILETAKQITDAGILNPKIFELVGLFEKNIGADRISDMIASILKERFYKYSHRIFSEFQLGDIEKISIQVKDSICRIPLNPFNRNPIILVPKDILQSLPIAETCGDIQKVCELNSEIRCYMGSIVGDAWKEILENDKFNLRAIFHRKDELKLALLKYPNLIKEILIEYEEKPIIRYNYEFDPANQFKFHSDARLYTNKFPLELSNPDSDKPEKIMSVSLEICNHFKRIVEYNGAYSFFYSDKDVPRHESVAQKFFFCIADLYCQVNNLDLSPEVNSGRGSVDFKISSGYKNRVLVEIKLTTNGKLLSGYKHQLVEYQKSESTIYAIYLVVHIKGGSEKNFEALKEISRKEAIRNKKGSLSQLRFVFVDAVPKASASHFKP